MNNKIPSEYWTRLNTKKCVVFIENHVGSNEYSQITLTEEQYKIVARLLFEIFKNKDGVTCDIKVENRIIKLPGWIKDFE